MIKINKLNQPQWWKEYIQQNKNNKWKELSTKKIKNYVLENEQKLLNRFFCVYCELTLNNYYLKPTIDHIKPVSKFPMLKLDYKNLVVTCTNCNGAKKNKWDNNFINPVNENPADFLLYDISTAKLIAKDSLNKKRVQETVKILNLNSPGLLNIRKDIFSFVIEQIINFNDFDKALKILLPLIPKSIYNFFIENKVLIKKELVKV